MLRSFARVSRSLSRIPKWKLRHEMRREDNIPECLWLKVAATNPTPFVNFKGKQISIEDMSAVTMRAKSKFGPNMLD